MIDPDMKMLLEAFQKDITARMVTMERHLEEKLQSFIDHFTESNRSNEQRHEGFRQDIKQCFARIDLNDRKILVLEEKVGVLEKANKEEKDEDKFKWERSMGIIGAFVGIFGLIVAAISIFFIG